MNARQFKLQMYISQWQSDSSVLPGCVLGHVQKRLLRSMLGAYMPDAADKLEYESRQHLQSLVHQPYL